MSIYHWKNDQAFNELPLLPPTNFKVGDISSTLLQETLVAIAELRGYISSFSEVHFHHLLSPLFLVESMSSSEIENIMTTLESVLEHQLENRVDESSDQKVLNYRDALMWGWEQVIEREPISERLIKGLHERLLPNESHGWRREQNQIINEKTRIVRYTPPSINNIPALLTNFENFVNTDQSISPLIRAAISHYQFEATHPFNDGNGRAGRMLLTLQPVMYDLLPAPLVHISRYINQNRTDYYKLLLDITENENWKGFIEFILEAYRTQAIASRVMLRKLSDEQEKVRIRVKQEVPSIYQRELVEALFQYPIINPTRLAEQLGNHYQTSSKYLHELEKMGILQSYKRGRNLLFINHQAIKIISE